MVGLSPVLLLLAVFIWLGVSPRSSVRRTWLWLLVLIVAIIILDYASILPGTGSH